MVNDIVVMIRDDDGLTADWGQDDLVWCNPPYGPQ